MEELEFWQRVYIAAVYAKGKSPKVTADHAVINMKDYFRESVKRQLKMQYWAPRNTL